MPQTVAQEFITEPKRLRGLPLCFYGCPRTATMKPAVNLDSSSSSSSMSARSASSSKNNNNNNHQYYKSKCPNPEIDLRSSDDDAELPQADGAASISISNPSASSFSVRRSREESEFSGSLSAEFLSQSSTDFGGQRSQRSSSSSSSNTNTAVICASLNSVHQVLSDTVVVGLKLNFPGDGSSIDHNLHYHDSNFVSFSSALTSQSAPLSKFHCVFVYLTVVLIFTWS